MILTTRLLGMKAGAVKQPATTASAAGIDTGWFFAPHMYGNPFQDVLNGKLTEQNIQPLGFRQISAAVDALLTSKLKHRVLHLHWLNVVLAGAHGESEESQRIATFATQLERVKSAGGKIVWTVHNVLPHENYSEAAAVKVRNLIVQAADWVHIMSPDTAEKCAARFTIPAEKILRFEHPGYHGVYPELDSGLELRSRWGLPTGGQVMVILGGIKPYKGLNQFAAEFANATVETPRKLSLLIAGKPSQTLNETELWQIAELSSNIHVLPETVADPQVSELMNLADIVAIPYQASLNSGALALALTYGKPVLAKSTAGSTHLLSDGAGKTYSNEAELLPLLQNTDWVSAATAAAQQMSRKMQREIMVTKFAQAARAFVDSGLPAAKSVIGETGGLVD